MRRTILKAAALALACVAPAAAQTVPAAYPAEYAQKLEAARAEGSLLIYTNMEAAQWEGAVELFGKLLPDVKVRFLELNGGEIGSRFAAETASGQPSADLIVTTDVATWVRLMEEDKILPYESPEGSVYPDWSRPHPGLYTIAADPMMFMWNKMLLTDDQVPKGMADLAAKVAADPGTYDGRLASYDATTPYGYNAFGAFAEYHGEKAWEWLSVIAPQTKPDMTGPMLEKVTSGEYVLAYFMGAGAARLALRDPARAEIVGLAPIGDGNPIVLRGAAVPRSAKAPEAATVMLDVLLSREGQISLGKRARTPLRPDVTAADVDGGLTYADVVKSIGEENVIPVAFEPSRAKNETFDAFVKRYREAASK